jgi:3-oxoacyl-(acyl-carrier-protein) synthase
MKVAITGWSLRTSLGASPDAVLDRLLAGETAAQPNARFDARSYACTLAAPVPGEPGASRHRRYLRRLGLFGMETGKEALAHAGGGGGDGLGLFCGVGGLRAHWDDLMPAFARQQPGGEAAWERGFQALHPFWMLHHLSNNTHALLSIELQARGEGTTHGGANAGAQALSSALRTLRAGAVERALVMSYDSLLEPETLVELGEDRAARTSLEGWVRPYATGACGYVPGEAAAALVLEPAAAAGSRALAFVDVREGADGERGHARPGTLARLARPLTEGAIAVDGAGVAQGAYDLSEREALALDLRDALLTSFTSGLGQVGAPTALVQAVLLARCLARGEWPPIGPGAAPGPLCPVVGSKQDRAGRAAVGVSTGAPGLAAAVRVELPWV